MTISRSCRHSVSGPVMFWTTVFLILLARGVSSISEDHFRYARSPQYEPEVDISARGVSEHDQQDVVHLVQELLRRQQQLQSKRNPQATLQDWYDWQHQNVRRAEKANIPFPLLYQYPMDGKKEDKKGSYIGPCYFKVCNLG